jgi:hypothetical protein
MKVNVIFEDWKEGGKSIYNTEKGVDLSMGSMHSGSTWTGEINFDPDTEEQLRTKGDLIRAIFEIEPEVKK